MMVLGAAVAQLVELLPIYFWVGCSRPDSSWPCAICQVFLDKKPNPQAVQKTPGTDVAHFRCQDRHPVWSANTCADHNLLWLPQSWDKLKGTKINMTLK